MLCRVLGVLQRAAQLWGVRPPRAVGLGAAGRRPARGCTASARRVVSRSRPWKATCGAVAALGFPLFRYGVSGEIRHEVSRYLGRRRLGASSLALGLAPRPCWHPLVLCCVRRLPWRGLESVGCFLGDAVPWLPRIPRALVCSAAGLFSMSSRVLPDQ